MTSELTMQALEPETPDDEKASNVSYVSCNNSYYSQAFCWRF